MKTNFFLFSVCFFVIPSHYAASQSERADSSKYEIIHLDQLVRTGAVCHDNTRTRSTGAGTCANHGGVKYWLYAEKSVYQANIQNLPAIPNKSLVRLKPNDVENIIRLGIDVFTYLRRQKHEERQRKGYQDEAPPPPPQDNYEAKPKDTNTAEHSQTSEKDSFHWLYIALLNTLIVILVVFLVFTLVFFVIKKLMEK